jgi:hypothetical protein
MSFIVWVIGEAGFVSRDGEMRFRGKVGFTYEHDIYLMHL